MGNHFSQQSCWWVELVHFQEELIPVPICGVHAATGLIVTGCSGRNGIANSCRYFTSSGDRALCKPGRVLRLQEHLIRLFKGGEVVIIVGHRESLRIVARRTSTLRVKRIVWGLLHSIQVHTPLLAYKLAALSETDFRQPNSVLPD